VTEEVDRLAERLNILAHHRIGCAFVGLFGTVWGIMRSFSDIAGANNTEPRGGRARDRGGAVRDGLGPFRRRSPLSCVQPHELRHQPDGARLIRFADGFHGTLSRELEFEG
jgi:biopolymer transport protein TolQ